MTDTWKTLETRTLVKDRWIHLTAETCQTPEGREIAPYYILTYPDWVNIVAITDNDEVLLVRQYRHAAGKTFLELPGGGVEAGDAGPEEAARRELEEETGYRAGRMEFVTTLYPNPASHTNLLHVYLAQGVVPSGPPRLDAGEEGLTVQLMPVAELVDQLRAGALGEALHVASVMMALMAAGRIGPIAGR
jgi:8-oxo-dGTP pyrophosphatase MutT (NUDIX family)